MDIKWIKLSTDIFNNRKIRQIECMPEGDTIIVIWLKILALAGEINDYGQIYLTRDIPYTEQLLATQFNRPIATVHLALQTFQQFGMIKIVDELIYVSNWEKYQSIEGMERVREQNRLRNIQYRERKRIAASQNTPELPSGDDMTSHVTSRDAVEVEREKEKDGDKERSKREKTAKRFTPPTVEEVKAYCKERNNSVDAERFVSFYESKGWVVGKSPMRDWKAAVRNWERPGDDKERSVQHPKHDNIPSTFNVDSWWEKKMAESYGGKLGGQNGE